MRDWVKKTVLGQPEDSKQRPPIIFINYDAMVNFVTENRPKIKAVNAINGKSYKVEFKEGEW